MKNGLILIKPFWKPIQTLGFVETQQPLSILIKPFWKPIQTVGFVETHQPSSRFLTIKLHQRLGLFHSNSVTILPRLELFALSRFAEMRSTNACSTLRRVNWLRGRDTFKLGEIYPIHSGSVRTHSDQVLRVYDNKIHANFLMIR